MTVDFAAIVDQLEADAGFRARLRAVVLSDELLEVPERVAALDRHVAEVDAHIAEVDAHIAEIDAHVAEIDARVAVTNERLGEVDTRLTARLDALTEQLAAFATATERRFEGIDRRFDAADRDRQRLHDDLGLLKGRGLEEAVAAHPGRYLSNVIGSPRARDVETFDRSALTAEEDFRLVRTDLIVAGKAKGSGGALDLFAAVEVSWRAHVDDLERALDRASLLARVADLPVLPVAVSKVDPGDTVVERASELGVALVTDDDSVPRASGRLVVA